MSDTLILGTRKGMMMLGKQNGGWDVVRHEYVGVPVSYAAIDARNDRMWAAADHGHWGIKLYRSDDCGENWEEVPAPQYPDVLWQQNHCGVFRSADGACTWQEISQVGGPVHFGFAIAVDAKDENVAWVVPAISDEIRMAIDGALCVCRTDDGGQTWTDFREGLPQKNCFDVVYCHGADDNSDSSKDEKA